MSPLQKFAARFWAKVDRRGNDECWPWTAGGRGTGYGAIAFGGKVLDAHRVAYQLTKGDIPDGHDVMHACDRRECCNPAHLSVGTRLDNVRDMDRKGRRASRETMSAIMKAKGIRPPNPAKLTIEQAREIRTRALAGEERTVIAEDFGINVSTVTRIANGTRWPQLANDTTAVAS